MSIFNLISKFWKEVIGMLRISFLLLIFFIFAIARGWLTCDAERVKKDLKNGVKGAMAAISSRNLTHTQWNEKEESRNENRKNYYIIRHQVREGETLLDLQAEYGTHWKVIQKVNGIKNPNYLRTGEIIRVPIIMDYG